MTIPLPYTAKSHPTPRAAFFSSRFFVHLPAMPQHEHGGILGFLNSTINASCRCR